MFVNSTKITTARSRRTGKKLGKAWEKQENYTIRNVEGTADILHVFTADILPDVFLICLSNYSVIMYNYNIFLFGIIQLVRLRITNFLQRNTF